MKWYVGSYPRFHSHDAVEVYPLEARFYSNENLESFYRATEKYRFILIDAIECFIREIELMDINDAISL